MATTVAVLAVVEAVASRVVESTEATSGAAEAAVAGMAEAVQVVGTGLAMAEEVSAAAGVAEGWAEVAPVGVMRVVARLAEEVMAMAMLAAVAEPAADQQGCLGESLAVGVTAGEEVAGQVEVETGMVATVEASRAALPVARTVEVQAEMAI